MTAKWLYDNMINFGDKLIMRPEDSDTKEYPDFEFKWDMYQELSNKYDIQFVLEDRPNVVRTWKERGVYVFDCNQDPKLTEF